MHVFSKVLKTLLFVMCTIAYAQTEPGQWVKDLYLVQGPGTSLALPYVFIDEANVIRETIPSIAYAVDFPVPVEQRLYAQHGFWYNDAFYMTAHGRPETKGDDDDGEEFKRWTLAKWQDDEWHFVGEYKTDKNEFIIFIPCANDRFIVISRNSDLSGNKGATRTPFIRMSLPSGKNEFKIDFPIAHGMDDLDMSNPNLFQLALTSRIIITDNFATLINKATGLYWIFSLETASILRTGKVFKDATAKWISNGGNSRAIYCVNPQKDGLILLVAHPDEALDQIGDVTQEMNEIFKQQSMTLTQMQEIRNSRLKALDNQYPFLVWHQINPGSGRAKKVIPPMGALIVKDDKIGNLWRPMPDGTVKMGALRLNKDEPKKIERKEDDEEKDASGKTNKIEQTAIALTTSDKQITK
jgi:hypothetical protein